MSQNVISEIHGNFSFKGERECFNFPLKVPVPRDHLLLLEITNIIRDRVGPNLMFFLNTAPGTVPREEDLVFLGIFGSYGNTKGEWTMYVDFSTHFADFQKKHAAPIDHFEVCIVHSLWDAPVPVLSAKKFILRASPSSP